MGLGFCKSVWTTLPVLDEACKKPNPEEALLDLKICDPACGSGHFLIAAAHRIAKRLAAIRAGEDEPAPESIQHALRDVVGRCIYGVDINPMAVELCKINLWMEALEPGRPLTFLEHHIRPGNSLLGTTPALMKRGIPDDAFKPIEGDDKKVCAELKKRNKDERRGQGLLPFGQPPWLKLGNLIQSFANLTDEDDSTPQTLAAKEQHFAELVRSTPYENAWLVADAWCAAFVCEKRPNSPIEITEAIFRRWEDSPFHLTPTEKDELLRLRNQYNFFHWHLAFPEVFKPKPIDQVGSDDLTGWAGGFDCVLGNPPFVNAIEGSVSVRCKLLSRYRSPSLGGTADQAFEFLSVASEIASTNGYVGLVQPRSLLNAPACEVLRGELMKRLPPQLIFIGKRPDLFAGAAVFICLVSLGGPHRQIRVAMDDEPSTASWRTIVLETTNWWGEALGAAEGLNLALVQNTVPLGERFEVSASMTTGDAYDVLPFVTDTADGNAMKLVTTGLIDPGVCLWGQVSCRYLKHDFLHPRIVPGDSTSPSIRRRLQKSQRPKIIVAGLSKQIECFVDRAGEFVGAVSTFSIYHPDNDVDVLDRLCEYLLTEDASVRFRLELGGNAMGGGNTTMKKGFLESFPIPKEF